MKAVALSSVGIIANPASGKDIRRLVAHATTVDNQGKISIVRRALIGLAATKVQRVLMMPDTHNLCTRAIEGLSHLGNTLPEISLLDMPVTGQTEDSARAARLLREAGVGCIITLGGDGTVRVVSKECASVPLLPISTGTNNVLPSFVEGTIAGLAAGLVAQQVIPVEQVALAHKWLELKINGRSVDRALVDVAVLGGQFLGARAVWDVSDMRLVVVTRADAAAIGISAIAGMIRPTSPSEPVGVALEIDPASPQQIVCAFGPGLITQVGVGTTRLLAIGE